MTIDPQRVEAITKDCLFRDEELTNGRPSGDFILVNGIQIKFGFHAERLERHRQEVYDMLLLLPLAFHASGGGGWTFLEAHRTQDGGSWGTLVNAEALMCLGLGLKLVTYQFNREMWELLPGGVPYFVFHDHPQKEVANATIPQGA